MQNKANQQFDKYSDLVDEARNYAIGSIFNSYNHICLDKNYDKTKFSLLCYLPFWLSKSNDINAAMHVARINVAAVLAASIIEDVLDKNIFNHDSNINLTPILLSIGAWINDYAEIYGWKSEARYWLDRNCAALIAEAQTPIDQRAFMPYRKIGNKYCFALFSANILSPAFLEIIDNLTFIFQFFDEYMDIFDDVVNCSHNDLLLILAGPSRDILVPEFRSNFIRTGGILIKKIMKISIILQESGFDDLGSYCSTRIPYIEKQMSSMAV